MKRMNLRIRCRRLAPRLGALLLAALPVAVDSAQPLDAGLAVVTVQGDRIQPFARLGTGAALVLFIATDCPIANRYAPEMEKIRAAYEPRGVRMTLVHVAPELSEAAAKAHAAAHALQAPVVIDRTHRLVKVLGARITPEAFVVDAAGRIRYRGRIDDQATGYGSRRKAASVHDLRDALDAVLEGREVVRPETQAIGCLIPDLPQRR